MGGGQPASVSEIPLPVLILSAACLITLSMLFSVSESAILSMNKLRLRVRRRQNDRRALRVSRLLKRKEIIINTLLVANDLVNVLLSAILTAAALKTFGEKAIGITTAVTTILLLLFGEITPKAICTRHPDPIAYRLSAFISVVVFIMHPVVILFTAVSRIALKVMGIKIKKSEEAFTVEEIKTFIDVSEESGILERGEKKLMNRVFKFTDLEAQNIMIPRTKIVGVKLTASYDEVIELSERTFYSRFPVYKDNIDDIVGTLYVKDLLFYSGDKENFSLKKVMRPPLFILGTKKMSSIQQMLRENRQTMAIVVDEYSGTDGILTKEDIAFEIFGANVSEFKNQSDNVTNLPTDPESDNFTIEGGTRLVDLSEFLHIKIESEFNETIAGYILERLDRMPRENDSVEFEGTKFTVEKITARRIDSVRVERRIQHDDENRKGLLI